MRRGKDCTDSRIEIRSNILGDIAKIRKGVVFKEYATVIDELFQNCQRAHATKIEVTIDGDHLRIVDNGVGCRDPQAVFEKNTSAWGNEDEAFGEGFFSVFLLADKLHVRSHNWKLSLDVLEMFETGDLSINVEEAPTIVGFEVDIIGEAVRREYYQLLNEAIMLGQIMPEVSVSVNGRTLQHRELLSLDTSNPTYKFNNDRFEAVLTPSSVFGTLEMFYEHRPVREDYMPGVTGRVHIKKGMITLKAPDRKEYIYDEKRIRLREDLRLCVIEMYKKFIAEATDNELDRYAEQIDEYLNVDDYLDYLPVSDDLLNLGQDNEDETEDSVKDSVKEVSKEVKQLIRKLSTIDEDIDYDIDYEMPKEPIRSRRSKGNLRELIAKSKKVLWVRPSEVDKLRSKIADAEYYGFLVLVAKNKLYENAFQSLGIPNVENLDECIEREVIKSNIGPQSKKEMRFTALMKSVEKHYELDEGSIQLADLELQIKHKKTGEVISKGGEVHGLCDRKEGKIYINRKLVKFPKYRAQAPDYPNITAHDYRALMRVQNTLAHELSHLLLMTEDNTLEHAQGISKISRELAELF